MKRINLIRYLTKEGCIFVREGKKHSVFYNPFIKRSSTIPRHNEVNNFLAKKICRDLGVKNPSRY